MISPIFLFLGVVLRLGQGSLLPNNILKSVGYFLKPNAEIKMRETSAAWNKAIGTGMYEVAYLNKQKFIRKFIIKMKESDGIEAIYLEIKDSDENQEDFYTKADEIENKDTDSDESEDFGTYEAMWKERWESDWKHEYSQCFDKIARFYKPFADFEFAADGGDEVDDFDWWMWVVGVNRNTGETVGYKCFSEVESEVDDVTVERFDPVEDGVISNLEAGTNGREKADNIYALLLSCGNAFDHRYPNDIMFAFDQDLPITLFWLLRNTRFDVNKIYQHHEGSFSIFQYFIHKEAPRFALEIIEEYDVEVLKKDGNGLTVLDYHRPHHISPTARAQWSELDQKLQRKAEQETNLKRKRKEKYDGIDAVQYSFEFLQRNLSERKKK